MNEEQHRAVENFAKHIKQTNPGSIGIAYLVLSCGCLQGGPFDEDGEQSGPMAHILTKSHGDAIEICADCMADGGSPERVVESAMLFFNPAATTSDQKERLCSRIFSDSLPST
jgi:hypothetical protein